MFWQTSSIKLAANSSLEVASGEHCCWLLVIGQLPVLGPGRAKHVTAHASAFYLPMCLTCVYSLLPYSAIGAGSQVYGGVDWVATAISADENAGGASSLQCHQPHHHFAHGAIVPICPPLAAKLLLPQLPPGVSRPTFTRGLGDGQWRGQSCLHVSISGPLQLLSAVHRGLMPA